MEESRNFQWFVQELTKRRLKIPFLNTILCAGDYTREKYISELNGNAKQVQREPVKTKHALNSLIDEKSPILGEYEPDKLICVIYNSSGVSYLTVNHILSLSPLRISSMKIRSIHSIPVNCQEGTVIKVKATYHKQNLKFSCKKRLSNSKKELDGNLVKQKAKDMISILNDYLQKASSNVINGIVFDFLMDQNESCYLLKVTKVTMCGIYIEIPDQKLKHSPSVRFSSNNNNRDFVEMLRKTVESERKQLPSIMKNSLNMSSMNILSMEDLLEGMEFARPKIWARDLIIKSKTTKRAIRTMKTNIQDPHSHQLPWLRPFDPSQSAIKYRQEAESRKKKASQE